ncbi:hypothetical protein [Marinomonas shanghaiensis]|uniref:hypothetical protein n=1 Tax=Marinomonas shanghaiensis TaxID=2202418 RepID=UPI003A954491
MSDLATQYDDGVFEPDEEILMSALRNQDDIPILMDIVAEIKPIPVMQDVHITQPLGNAEEPSALLHKAQLEDNVPDDSVRDALDEPYDDSVEDALDEPHDDSLDGVVTLNDVVTESALSQELIAKTIASVLEKRLPDLVAEVMQALQAEGAGVNQKE